MEMAGTFTKDEIIESYRRQFASTQSRMVKQHNNAAIPDALHSSRLLNATL